MDFDQILEIRVSKTRVRESFAVQVETYRRGHCSGRAKGKGVLRGQELVIIPDDDLSPTEDLLIRRPCHITISFNSRLNKAKIQEHFCNPYHGAHCSFSGSVKRVSRNFK